MPTTRKTLLAVALLLLAGCGGASTTDQSAEGAQAAYEDWSTALAATDVETACSYMPEAYVRASAEQLSLLDIVDADATCPELVAVVGPLAEQAGTDEELTTTLTDETTAVVVATGEVDGEATADTTRMTYTGGRWSLLPPETPSLSDLTDLLGEQLGDLGDDLGAGLDESFGDGAELQDLSELNPDVPPEVLREIEKQMQNP